VKPARHLPFYQQMTGLLRNAFTLLEEEGWEEVMHFVVSQQNPDGGFQDRGGRSDLYYSLFGWMMLNAMESEVRSPKSEATLPEPFEGNPQPATRNPKHLFQQFISTQSTSEVPGFIERCCLVLLQKDLKAGWYLRLKPLWSLGLSFWKERYSINLSYRSFVLFLTLEAVLPFSGILKSAAKRMLLQTHVDENSPCSEVAAKVFLEKMMNRDGSGDQELLKSFACESGGFKAFQHLQNADMLSTAVSLFALNFAKSDLRLFKPACLDFIQENYANGAFLSGDGDLTEDLEYTFYGLLALGVLSN
jgi:prenyltransferase beta subunit